ncbi:MAG: Rab family GTPase [Candidatus Helarchaeota archaeon]
MAEYDFKYKIVVIGDPAVGKTTLMLQYTEKKFKELYIPTVGVQVSVKNVLITQDDRSVRVGLYIWDIAGQVKFAKIRKLFYEGANAFIIVYDLTDKDTFINSSRWYKDISDILGKENIHGVLVGNKKDLTEKREISQNSGQLLADKMGLLFFETSAKTGENVDKLFMNIANNIYENFNKKIDMED